jgi:tRNA(fMet)-specific endonuclease VapC
MAPYLLDTNICIYIQKVRPESVARRFESLRAGEAFISVITWGELQYGAARSQQRDWVTGLLDEFRALVPVLPLPDQAGLCYGSLRADLSASGLLIGNNDLWIAAHALAAGMTLVTNNEREFLRVPGLRMENWV